VKAFLVLAVHGECHPICSKKNGGKGHMFKHFPVGGESFDRLFQLGNPLPQRGNLILE
jgi:hypothetical protein